MYAQFTLLANTTRLSLGMLVLNVSLDTANCTIHPYFTFVQSLATQFDASSNMNDQLVIERLGIKQYPSFWDLYQSLIPSSGAGLVGYNLEISSWLMPQTMLEKNHAQVANTLVAATPGLSYECVVSMFVI